MYTVTPAFNDAVTEGAQTRTSRIVLLDSTMTAIDALEEGRDYLTDGDILDDRLQDAARRTCSLSLANPEDLWTPDTPADPFFLNRIFRPERGLEVAGQTVYVPQGVYMVDHPRSSATSSDAGVLIQARDLSKLGVKSGLRYSSTWPKGTRVRRIIVDLAEAIGYDIYPELIDDDENVIGSPYSAKVGDYRWTHMRALATIYSLDLYFDADGRLNLRPLPSVFDTPVWTFRPGDGTILTGHERNWGDDEWVNAVRVETTVGPLVAYEARDLNPQSPGYNPFNPDDRGPYWIGDRFLLITVDAPLSLDQARRRAEAELAARSFIVESYTITSVVHPALEAGDLIRLALQEGGTDALYLIDQLRKPLGEGGMSFTVSRTRSMAP